MKRRSFLKNSIAVPLAMQFKFESRSEKKIRPIVMATDWGYSDGIKAFCSKARKAGYDGIEVWWAAHEANSKDLFEAIQENNLEVGFLVGDGSSQFAEHFENFKTKLDSALNQIVQKPLYINCHSGKDFFTKEENTRIIDYVINAEKKSGIAISHETHRGRMCYSAPLTYEYLNKNPEMFLTLDISHWCNVHESYLKDQSAHVSKALERTRHIHLRVGHPEGPQVSDPRAPEWEHSLNQHLKWWDEAVNNRLKKGYDYMTFLPEFGPPHYMPTIPYTQMAVANQWEINEFMMNLIRERYS